MIEHFHAKIYGCVIKIYYKKSNHNYFVNYYKCETHRKKICKCGWEIHWHGGENSCKLFPKGKQDKQTFDTLIDGAILN